MSAPQLQEVALEDFDGGRRAVATALAGCAWFTGLRRLHVQDRAELRSGAEEACALLLSGTFDLVGGTTSWPSRGARTAPAGGRPVAVFLPPDTPFVAANGSGEILVVTARQPDRPEVTGHEALEQKPLLPLAGSGKSFDPASGEWRPAESFATAAEHLTPRRMQRLEIDGAVVERVFAADYKAATLTVDEVVLPAGGQLSLSALDLPEAATETLCYVRCDDGAVTIARPGNEPVTVRGEGAVLSAGPPGELTLAAADGPAFVAVCHAGK